MKRPRFQEPDPVPSDEDDEGPRSGDAGGYSEEEDEDEEEYYSASDEEGGGGGAGGAGGASGSDEEDGSDLDDDEAEIQEQLADIPFEVLERIREDGHVAGPGRKGSAAGAGGSGRGKDGKGGAEKAAREPKKVYKRDNKNRPAEMPSNRPVGRFRDVTQEIGGSKKRGRDPRFEAIQGVEKDLFRKRYKFIFDEQLPKEKQELQARLKKERSEGKKEQLRAAIQKIDQQIRSETDLRKRDEVERTIRTREKAAVMDGKKPFFLKKADKKQLVLVEKFKELKKAGRLDKYLEKRRKKNASKDHRFMPSSRREGGD